MWNTDSIWLEISIVSSLSAIGSMLLGHFEQHTTRARVRQVIKLVSANLVTILISIYAGRVLAFGFLGILFLSVLYIHIIWLPKKGINGWTGEPREKYLELRGWKKNSK